MSLMDDAEVGYPETSMDLDARARFVSRVYTHVFAAIVAFTALEIVLFTSGLAQVIARVMLGGSWLIVRRQRIE